MTVTLEGAFTLDDQVALRPEPFGALAYHYGNRRLVFLRSPRLVEVVRSLAAHPDLAATLRAAGVPERRWGSYVEALESLARSEVIRARR